MSVILSSDLTEINVVDSVSQSQLNDTNINQCYIDQDNTISFNFNNASTFTNENGEMFYACITTANNGDGDTCQQDQILQLIPQNQLSNYILSSNNNNNQSINIINQPTLLSGNQFIDIPQHDNNNKIIDLIKKQHCLVCEVDFPSKRAYSKHMTLHENDREFKCTSCKMSYNYEVNLLVHIAIIHPNQCSFDNNDDNVNNSIDNNNIDCNVDAAFYRCLVCSLKFTRTKALQGHCLIHQVDEELSCDLCSQTFKSRIILNRHIDDHSNEIDNNGNYSKIPVSIRRCKVCQTSFENVGQIKRHYKLCHPKIVESSWDNNNNNNNEDVDNSTTKIIDNIEEENFDPSKKRKSSKVASQTIKLYAQGKLKQPEESTDVFVESKRRGRPKKTTNSPKLSSSKNSDVVCSTCNRSFKTPILLRRHEVTHTGLKEFECPLCQKKFTQKSSVKIHMVVHENDKAFQCQFCHKSFTYEHNMNTHIKTVHRMCDKKSTMTTTTTTTMKNGENIVEDDRIGRRMSLNSTIINNKSINRFSDKFNNIIKIENLPSENYWSENIATDNVYIPSTQNFTKIDWDNRQNVSAGGILLSEEINKLDKETGQLQVHELIKDQITGFRRFRCRFCKKLYRRSCDLSRHVRIHSHQRPFKCYLCYRSFRLKSVLKNHFKSHWKLKEFPCEVCSKSFNLKQTLKVHSRLHRCSEMKYCCDICQKRFNSSFHYKYHNRTQHKQQQQQQQETQEVVFLESDGAEHYKSILINGKQFVHSATVPIEANRPFKCVYCNKSYKLKRYLRDHLKEHGNCNRKTCNYCQKTFLTLRSLQQHSRTQHVNRKTFSCSLCSATFILKASLIRHGLVHSTSRPYACPFCFRQFKAKVYCDRHISLRKCNQKSQLSKTVLTSLDTPNEINKLGANIESEIIKIEQQQQYRNFRLIDLDLNNTAAAAAATQTSNILVTNYVNQYSTYSSSDNIMVVSLDTSGTVKEEGGAQGDSQGYYGSSNCMIEDSGLVESSGDMLESQMDVTPVQIGAIYNYGVAGGFEEHSQQQQQQQQDNNIYYYQAVEECEEQQHHHNQQQPLAKGSLADKFPILKASLFSDDDSGKCVTKTPAVIYCHENRNNFIDTSDNNNNSNNNNNSSLLQQYDSKYYHGCANCRDEFPDSNSLIQHVKMHHKIEKDFLCNICHKSFSVNLSLWAHSKIHDTSHSSTTNQDFLSCIACDQKFISVPSLSRHVRMQHNDKLNLYRCTHCDRSYKTTRELDSHIKQLNSDYDAILINSNFISNQAIDKTATMKITREIKDPNFCKDFLIELQDSEIDHIASLDVSKTSKLSMQELIKAAKEKRGLKKSTRQSKSDQSFLDPLLTYPYSCSVCHKGFNRASNLQQHLSVHTKMKPYQCSKCSRKFRHRCSLKTHETTKHSVMMKLLRCHLCMKLLRSQVALRNHMKIHLKNYSFRCEKCLRNFSTYQEQMRHVKLKQCQYLVDNQVVKINNSSKGTVDIDAVAVAVENRRDDSAIKLMKCVTCSVAFYSIFDYENHCCNNKQSRKSHQCVLCDETFISSSELCLHICDVHKQQQKYNCSLCNLLFVKESLLLNHQRTVHNNNNNNNNNLE